MLNSNNFVSGKLNSRFSNHSELKVIIITFFAHICAKNGGEKIILVNFGKIYKLDYIIKKSTLSCSSIAI